MVNRLELYWPRPYPQAFSDHELQAHNLRSAAIELVFVLREAKRMSAEELCQVTRIVEQLSESYERLRNR
jgi:hypothetical protein